MSIERDIGEINGHIKAMDGKLDRALWRLDDYEGRIEELELAHARGDTWRSIRERGLYIAVGVIVTAIMSQLMGIF